MVVLAIPAVIFLYLGLLKLIDFAQVYSYTSAAAIVVILAWGFRHRIQRLIPKTSDFGRKSEFIVEHDGKNSGEKLDFLILAIENFTRRWRKTLFLRLSYRRLIQRRAMYEKSFLIRKHAKNISDSNKSFKSSILYASVVTHKDLFGSIDGNCDRLVDLGWQLESIFDENTKTIKQIESSKMDELVSEGDIICENLRDTVPKLEKLRKTLP